MLQRWTDLSGQQFSVFIHRVSVEVRPQFKPLKCGHKTSAAIFDAVLYYTMRNTILLERLSTWKLFLRFERIHPYTTDWLFFPSPNPIHRKDKFLCWRLNLCFTPKIYKNIRVLVHACLWIWVVAIKGRGTTRYIIRGDLASLLTLSCERLTRKP